MAFVEMKKRKEEEYEMQLFGFHSRAVNATLKSIIHEKIRSRCKKLCESLEKKFKPEGDDLKILHRNRRELMNAYYLGCKSQFPAIEKYVKKFISIPEYVLLNEDKIQVNQYTDEEFNEMKCKLEDLQQRLKKAMIFNGILKDEMEMLERFDKNIDTANMVCEVVETSATYPDVNNTMNKLIDNYEELQSNINNLENGIAVTRKKRCSTVELKSYDANFL